MFPKNEGPIDRIIRIVVGILLLPAGMFLLDGVDGDVVGVIVSVLGFVALATGLAGRCLLYYLFGISTLHESKTMRHGRGATAH